MNAQRKAGRGAKAKTKTKTQDELATRYERLTALVGRFAGRRVTVLGDLVADEFVYADIARVSREAPVLILDHRNTTAHPGGGGNAVANLAALGAQPCPVGLVGRDASGKRLVDALKKMGCDVAGIVRQPGYETPTKSRLLAGGVHTRRQQIVRLDRGAARGEFPTAVRTELGQRLRDALRDAEGLLVADYSYGAATPGVISELSALLRRLGIPVTVDSRARVAEFNGLTACTPNQEEVEEALGLDALNGDTEVVEAGRALLRRTKGRAVVVTRGSRGMTLVERGSQPLHVAAYGSDEVADVTGAGDTVIATFTLALIAGGTLAQAVRLANYAAGLVVRKMGTATIGPDELLDAIADDLAEPAGDKRRARHGSQPVES